MNPKPPCPIILSKGSRFHRIRGWALAAIAASISCAAVLGETVEPQAFRLHISSEYLGLRVEAEQEATTYAGSSQAATYERLFAGPVIGLDATGSIYHPNLLSFSINGELSPGYSIEKTTYAGTTSLKQILMLGNYYANFIFLQEKPYRTTLYINQNYTYRDYDFFTRDQADILRYGATLGYQKGPVPFTIDAWQRQEQTLGLSNNSLLEESGLTLNARNKRGDSGETTFVYTVMNDNRTDSGLAASGLENSFSLGDSEMFGSRKQYHSTTSASYDTRQFTGSPGSEATAALNLSVEHTPTLSSFADVEYNRSTTDDTAGSAVSSGLHGGASLQHQLYESLTSTLRIQGEDYSSDGSYLDSSGNNSASSSDTQRYGGGVTESYSKRLGSIGHLTMMGAVLYEHAVQNNGGSTIIQSGESHVFSSGTNGGGTDSFFLNLPYVDQSSIVITDTKHTLPAFQSGRDYTVSSNGSLTMIRRSAFSTIPENSAVLVDYRAQGSPSGNYDTLTGVFNLRVGLWNDLIAFYFRLNSVQNNGAANLLLQDMDLYSIGAEGNWRWLHAGAEYTSNASTYSTYSSVNLFQSLAFKLDEKSTLNFDLLESQTHYVDTSRQEENYSAITRFQRAFSQDFSLQFDAGIAVRRGAGVNQTLTTARSSLDWRLGRLTLKVSYSFEYGIYSGSDERRQNLLTLSMHRGF